MSRDHDELTEAELAEWQYAHREELDAEEGEPVEVSISPQLSVTMSFRLPGTEADAIRDAARAADMSLSEWIRETLARGAASAQEDEASWERDVEAELAEAEQRLDATTEALQDLRGRVRAALKAQSDQQRKTTSTKGTVKKSTKQSRAKSGAKKAPSGSKARKKAGGEKASEKKGSNKRADG